MVVMGSWRVVKGREIIIMRMGTENDGAVMGFDYPVCEDKPEIDQTEVGRKGAILYGHTQGRARRSNI